LIAQLLARELVRVKSGGDDGNVACYVQHLQRAERIYRGPGRRVSL